VGAAFVTTCNLTEAAKAAGRYATNRRGWQVLRSDGHCGEVRKGDCLFVPNRTINTTQAWRSTGYVFALPNGSARPFVPSGQKQPSIQDLHRRCRSGAFAVLDAIPSLYPVLDKTSASNGANTGRRGWRNVRRLDKAKAKAGANWVITLRYLVATGTTGRFPVRVARTGTTLRRTRTTTSVGAAFVSAFFYRSVNAKALRSDLSICGQPVLSSFGKYTSGFDRTQSSETSKGEVDFMGAKHRNLIDKITTMENLQEAYRKTSCGKKMSFGYLEFKEYDQANLLAVQQELKAGEYTIGDYRNFIVYEPKPRLISALDFKDRLVQHAVCNVITPIFDRSLLPYTFACRVGMGTHAGVKHIQALLRRHKHKYFLKTDFAKFFPTVNRARLHEMIVKKVRCEQTLKILREIIPTQGIGIPIGSLTSQLFANAYGNPIDRFIHFDLGHRYWARYMDDIVILDSDPDRLRVSFNKIQEFAKTDLGMGISKWQVSPVSQGINFLGYRIWPTHKLIRKDSVARAKKKVQKFIKHNDFDSLKKFIASWSGHAKWADTNNLFNWIRNRHAITF